MSGLSIATLADEQAKEERGFVLEIRDAHGEVIKAADGTPVTVTVAGKYSERYRRAEAAIVGKRWQSGRAPKLDRETLEADALSLTAQCVLGWSGIEDVHSPENVVRLLKNVHVREQIERAMEMPASFFGGASAN